MLGFVPYSFLEEHDIWYSDPGTIKERYGLEDLNSEEDIRQLEGEKGPEFMKEFGALPVAQSYTSKDTLKTLTGWNWVNIDRAVFNETPPPWGFSVVEGDFDEALIGEKLTEQGYAKSEYGSFTYYHINDDMQINMMSELGRMVLAQLNRVAVLDDTLVVAPATDIMAGVLDAMDGNAMTVIENTTCRALADSLGDVLMAVVTIPARIVQIVPPENIVGDVRFDFDIPDDWGTLHEYEMAALGYRAEGEKRFLEIALYYDDAGSAEADGAEIVKRMEGYILNTFVDNMENMPFTESYLPGKPEVHKYAGGAVLTVACELISEGRPGALFHMGGSGGGIRDMLFLAPDPSVYVKD
jgi:hypothetical protein